MLNDVGGSLSVLRVWNVGLEGCIRAVRLRSDVHSEIVRRSLAIRSRDNTVGREATWSEEVRVDASIRELALGVDI